jgi:hypothetical protein
MALEAGYRKYYLARNVNFKVEAVTNLIPVKTGKTFVPRQISIIGKTRTGTGTGPQVRIGISSAYNSVANSETPANPAALEVVDFAISDPTALDLATAVGFRVFVASTYTTHTGDVLFVGDEY